MNTYNRWNMPLKSLVVLAQLGWIAAVLTSGCGTNKNDTESPFALGLFYATTDRDWSDGITNITIAQVKYGTGFRTKDMVLSKASALRTETNEQKIWEMVQCFQSKEEQRGYKFAKVPHEWQIFISSRKNGDTRVVVRETDDPNVLAVKVTYEGPMKFIARCIAFP